MSDKITIVTNNVPRDVIYGCELTAEERAEFDYFDWPKIEAGEESDPEFVRYKGQLYYLGDFSTDFGITRGTGLPDWAKGWSAYISDTFFSGILIKWPKSDTGDGPDYERVIVGMFYVS